MKKYVKKFNDIYLNENIENIDLKTKLLSYGGKSVKLGLDSDDEINRMINDGILFDVDIVLLHGQKSQCHRNVADKYKKLSSSGFKIVSGYALYDDEWVQHSWGLNKNGDILETTGNEYQLYYGYILTDEESDDFCFYNY